MFDKSNGNPLLLQPREMADLGWDPATQSPCTTGIGDPIVLHDAASDRWVLSVHTGFIDSQHAGGLCVSVSAGPDPITGGWINYLFPTTNKPDYQKYGVWPDAYYVGAAGYIGGTAYSVPTAHALERAAMLAGMPAHMRTRTIPPPTFRRS